MPNENDIELHEVFEVLLAMEARMHREEVEQLRTALLSARQIGVALGIVMSHEDLGRDDAFAVLVRESRRSNRKLRDVAADVEQSGRPPLAREPRAGRRDRGR